MPVPPGWKPIYHVVRCADCPTTMLRVHYKTPHRCPRCKREYGLKRQYARKATWSTQARRYRIIMHVLGWEDAQFYEALQEMKRSPMSFRNRPETRDARFDEHTEARKFGRRKDRGKAQLG